MEHFEKLAFDFAQHNSSLWLCYIDDICGLASWPRAHTEFLQTPQQFKAFLPVHCGNRVRRYSSFYGCSGRQEWPPKSTENTPTFANIILSSNHLPHMKSSLIQGLHESYHHMQRTADLYDEIIKLIYGQ
jgi:hypothetical protein